MQEIIRQVAKLPQFHKIPECLKKHTKEIWIGNVWGASCFPIISCIKKLIKNPLIAVFCSPQDAHDAVGNLATFLADDAVLLPQQPVHEKIQAMQKILKGARRFIVSDISTLLTHYPDPHTFENYLNVKTGDILPQEKLISNLLECGYQREYMVERHGEFSRRGAIVDVFPLNSCAPYRIEFLGDRIESIREFDIDSQTSKKIVDSIQILLISENDLLNPPAKFSFFEYVKNPVLIIRDFVEIFERIEDTQSKNLANHFKHLTKIYLQSLPVLEGENSLNFNTTPIQRFSKLPVGMLSELKQIQDSHKSVVLFYFDKNQLRQLKEILKSYQNHKSLHIKQGKLSGSFAIKDISCAFISPFDFLAKEIVTKTPPKVSDKPFDSLMDLEVGDYVVHLYYGIGRYMGVVKQERKGKVQEFLVIEYHSGVKLYISPSQFHLVEKYIATTQQPPTLSRPGTRMWEKTKQRVKEATEKFAKELLKIHAIRNLRPGIQFPSDDTYQKEFEMAFEYQETDDQISALKEIKNDMQNKKPMDRLLCGDVGFGKTELAIRAAFKCAMHGKQVAVIVPTTVLAEQHLRTFTQRISNYPMNIEVLSRFKTKKQQQDIIKRLKEGNIDIIIGTHRLLQDDVEFKDLGLLIIDEEQRFGVEHKERLKKLRMNVDVLTLTATPIPRTLHLALLGIRDISILRSPPPGRYPIKTEVCIYDEGKIRNAILLELNRKGQVFYVYNRVYDINEVAWKVSKLVPQARVAVGHGQMDEEELEETMLEFYYGNIDVLVSTAIIESGLDLPNANTIIVENADMFGLCDLHQLRGRVGRSNRQAYAYFFIPKDRPITPDAYKRLKAIEEFSEIGSGFKIATRDMQIRGVGNILGKEQHGHIAQVGYELYCRMLENAIKELKKEPVEQRVDCMVTLRCECYIPDNYISHSRTRIETYRKFAKAESIKRIDELTDEIIDKFGKLPQPFSNLINQNKIKVLAQNMKFYAVAETPEAFAINYLDKEVLLYLKARLGSKLNIVNEKLAYLVKPENCKPQEAIKFILDAFLQRL